jgi:hypothetical protein
MLRGPNLGRLVLLSALSLAAVAGVASSSDAAPLTLTDQNSVIEIDPNSQAGMYTWQVDGIDNLFQRWFWYRIGSAGPESSIDTISAPTITGFGGSQDGKLTYENAALRVEIKYSLVGGAAGSLDSDLGEQVRITNKTMGSLSLHLFEYTDFDLKGTPEDDTASLVSPTAVLQTDGASNIIASESLSVTPGPSHREINIFSATRDNLNDGAPTTLNDGAGPVGPGDVTWAFEWDLLVPKDGTVLISKSLKDAPAAVPEPTILLMFGAGAAALRRRERRRLNSSR